MNIVVLGAGAVGGYFGGRLAQAGASVTFLVRQKRFDQLRNGGLQVASYHGDFTIPKPSLAVRAEEIENPDVVILGLKNYHLDAALPEIRTLVAKGATVLPLLNGIEHMEKLTQEFGSNNVLGGVCYIESTLDQNGKILHTSPIHDVVFGALSDKEPSWLGELADLFRKGGVNVTVSQNVTTDMWKKFIFLTTLSAITAATRLPVGKILADPFASALAFDILHDILSVAAAKSIQFDETAVRQDVEVKLNGVAPEMTSSMHRDLEKGLPIELDSLQGSVLRMANDLALSTPAMKTVYALLHPYLNGRP